MNSNTDKPKRKECTKCGVSKLFTSEFFKTDKRRRYGLASSCKECANKYRNKNKEKFNKYNREYHKIKKDEISKRKSQYYQDNKEEIAEYSKRYRLENAEKISAYKRKYKQENKDYFRFHKKKRKSMKKQLPSSLTIKQWEHSKLIFDNRCAYCGERRKLQQEHFIPLSKGGEYTHNNIIPACIHCNASKNNRDFFEWYPKHESYSKDREAKILNFLNYEPNKTQQLSIL